MKIIEERQTKTKKFVKPFPLDPEGCPGFTYLSWANGCPFDPGCAYCYLRHTFWRQGGNNPVVWTNLEDMVRQVKRWLDKQEAPALLNMGELSETFAFGEPFWKAFNAIWPRFEAQDKHGLLLVSKGAPYNLIPNPEWEKPGLLPPPHPNLIISFSITDISAGEKWEGGRLDNLGDVNPAGDSFFRRLNRAGELVKAGYRVRLRFDPLIPDYKEPDAMFSWDELTADWIGKQVASIKPEGVTLGFLRAVPGLYPRLPEQLRGKLVKTKHKHSWRVPAETRVLTYLAIVNALPWNMPVGLCKEPDAIWKMVFDGRPPEPRFCNCLPLLAGKEEQ